MNDVQLYRFVLLACMEVPWLRKSSFREICRSGDIVLHINAMRIKSNWKKYGWTKHTIATIEQECHARDRFELAWMRGEL